MDFKERLISLDHAERYATNRLQTEVRVFSVGCVRELTQGETRVAVTPEMALCLVKRGYSVAVEGGAGLAAGFDDSAYLRCGASITDKQTALGSDAVIKVRPPAPEEIELLSPGAILICFVMQDQAALEALAARDVFCFALDQMPRLHRTRPFDAVGSMLTVAGYKAVIEAANLFGRFLGGQMTAAGRIPAAKVLVIGAGIGGLSAVETATKMGAIVRCFDTRPSCREQVESLGAEFLQLEDKSNAEEYINAEMALFRTQAVDVDIIISTVSVPGRVHAPRLVTKDMIDLMKPGSVTVDLAASQGGNIETTVPDQCITTSNGVVCVGYTNWPALLPAHASKLFAKSAVKFLLYMSSPKDPHTMVIKMEDLAVRGPIATWNKLVVWPAPRHLYPREAPQCTLPMNAISAETDMLTERRKTFATALSLTIGLCVILSLNLISHNPNLLTLLVVFGLAAVAGYQMVWGVASSLHTPLMSVTNAISGLTAVAGLLLLNEADNNLSFTFAGAAVAASFINIFGGFRVTYRMVSMFRHNDGAEDDNEAYLIPAIASSVFYIVLTYVMHSDVSELTYLAASLCCVFAVGGFADQRSAGFGMSIGMTGVLLGVLATVNQVHYDFKRGSIAVLLIAFGCIVGYNVGGTVQTTDLPQTAAAFHSLVGLAALLTCVGQFAAVPYDSPEFSTISAVAAFVGTFVGGVTFTGSMVGFAKLKGLTRAAPLRLPARNYINLFLLLVDVVLGVLFMIPQAINYHGMLLLASASAISMFLGWHIAASMNTHDMPVCLTLLNSYAGWAMVAEGFMLDNLMLIIVGSLIGFSGSILSYVMCRAMNKSISSVLFATASTRDWYWSKGHNLQREASVDDVVEQLAQATSVILVPGYGMASAGAQKAAAEVARLLRLRGIKTRFALHPLAGRIPGQMNVLLAEAGVPSSWVVPMEEVNEQFSQTDVALVIGANDITNSAAEEQPHCILFGMPVLRVWQAKTCIFIKRSLERGYTHLDNPVFYRDNTLMVLGDAKRTLEAVINGVQSFCEV